MVACTTGMKTPRMSTVTSTVAIAANDGTALRLSARSASRRKKPILMSSRIRIANSPVVSRAA